MSSEPVSVLAQITQAPWQFDYFQALRKLQAEHPQLPRFGHSLRLSEDPVRFGQTPHCNFAPATLSLVDAPSAEHATRVEQFFFGLTGPNGPLPLHLTEYARERQRNHADPTFKRFLDVFHHRLLSLFFRAWAEARPSVSHDRPDDDYFAQRLAALLGRGTEHLLEHPALAANARLHYSGHLAAQTRYPDGLKAILSEYFNLPVRLEEYVGQWLALPERSRLGLNETRLGEDLCLGTHVWDRQHSFRIVLGPLTLAQYLRFLPAEPSFIELAAWVKEYLGEELDWELNLVLAHAHVPALQLHSEHRLGFNTWLGQPTTDADDLRLAGGHIHTTAQHP